MTGQSTDRTLPTFRTARLLVRPRTIGDLDACLSMDRDPQVTAFVPGPWADPAAHRAFVIARMESEYPEGLGYWSVTPDGRPEAFLGWILLLPFGDRNEEVEIGWRFLRANWGKGYASEAARVVLDHAFRTVGLKSVVALIHPRNLASMGVAEKIGMRHVGEREFEGMMARSYRADAPAP